MRFRQHNGGMPQPIRLAALACGLLGGALGILVAPLASGLLNDNAPLVVPQLLLLLITGVMSLVGVLRRARGGLGGIWSAFISLAVAVFIIAGLDLLYHSDSLLEPFGGLALLLAGELLLCSLARGWLGALPIRLRSFLLVTGLLLVSFVAPYSALPNPLGAYYLLAGGYRYDPHSPFVNRFATLWDGDPSALVSARLDLLIGQTGLAPLDPRQPLESYRVREVLSGGRAAWARVRVELRFADGHTRLVSIPALDSPAGRLTALDRLTVPLQAVPGIAPAGSDTSVQLGVLKALPLAPAADELVSTILSEPQASSVRWAPDGRTVLLRVQPEQQGTGERGPGLWVVPLDGGDPWKLVEEATDAVWSPDERSVVALTWQPQDGPVWRRAITAIDVATGVRHRLGVTDRSQIAVVRDQVYFLSGGVLWQVPVAGGSATRLAALPDAGPMVAEGALVPTPRPAHHRGGRRERKRPGSHPATLGRRREPEPGWAARAALEWARRAMGSAG